MSRQDEFFHRMSRQLSEQQFGDYKLLHIPPEMGNGFHRIVAMYGDHVAGEMNWTPKEIAGVDVKDEHQRRGLATAMWEMGQTMRPRPKHSADRTDQGDAWARKVGGRLPRRRPAER